MKSENFEALRELYPDLATLCTFAETYTYSDPASAVLKLRIFAEKMIGNIYRNEAFYFDKYWSFNDSLENRDFRENVDEKVQKMFDNIRRKGNKAAHTGKASKGDAIWLLKQAYELACWFQSLYGGPNVEQCKEFIKPVDQGSKVDILQQTINELEQTILSEKEKHASQIQDINKIKDYTHFKTKNKRIASFIRLNDEEINENVEMEDVYAEYDLTDEQQQLVKTLKFFLEDSSSNLFLLKGYAGTGKTFIIKGLADYLYRIGRTFNLSAPTGKAARVISSKTKREASTIHKAIYSNKDIKEFKVDNTSGTETYKFYYEIKVNEDPDDTVYIVDEASMISDIYSEQEFFRFGSGHLLQDFMRYVNLDNNDHNKKVIFIGDNAQLPPIGMKFSPALDEKYLLEHHQVASQMFMLMQVVRQDKDSGILKNAFVLRDALSENTFNKLDFNLDYEDVEHVEHNQLMKCYLESCAGKINAESIVIAHSNASVAEYNKRIREHFFPGMLQLCPGDKIMAVSNNLQHEIMISNGDFGLVKEVAAQPEVRVIPLKRKCPETGQIERIDVELQFRDMTVGFNDLEGKAHFFQCKIIENLLYSEKPDLNSDENKAIYVDFRMRNPHLRPGTKEHKDSLRSDPYFNAMRIKFGYAITCHKAQGSEWNNVFVNCKTHMERLNQSYFRWLYTGITRASKKLYVLDEPHITLTGKMTHIGGVFEESVLANDNIAIASDTNSDVSLVERFGINPDNSFLVGLFNSVNTAMEVQKIEIVSIQHHPYQEAYTFTFGKEKVSISVYYNSKNEISNIVAQQSNELSKKVLDLLSSLIHKKIIVKSLKDKISGENKFEFNEPFLEEFYLSLKATLQSHGIDIDNISSYQYLEKYTFSRGNEIASFDFNYNGKKQFTRFTEQSKNSTSIELIRELNQIFSKELG